MSHPSAETLAAYWLGELPEPDAFTLEDHVFACEQCTASSARMAALPRALTFAVRPVVSTSLAARLLALDPLARRVIVRAGGRVVLDFSGGAKTQLVVFESDLRDASKVDITVCSRAGTALVQETGVPFDAEAGTLIIACQSHYLKDPSFPLEITLSVEATTDGVKRSLGTFDIDHIPPV